MKHIRIFLGILISLFLSEAALAGMVAFGPARAGLSRDVRSFKEMRQENVVIQMTRYTCGAAALATIVNYYLGGKTTEVQVIDLTGEFDLTEEERRALDKETDMTDQERNEILRGTVRAISLLELKRAAEALGYEAGGYWMELEHLLKLDSPVIVHTIFRGRPHFSVLKGIRGNTVFLACPSLGNMHLSVGRFMKMWQGIAFVVSPQDDLTIPDHLLEIRPEYARGAINPDIRILLDSPPHLLGEVTLRQIRGQ